MIYLPPLQANSISWKAEVDELPVSSNLYHAALRVRPAVNA